MGRECETLVLLVGSNPLPNLLAAATLRPSCVWLMHSQETKSTCDRLALALDRRLSMPSCPLHVGDPWSRQEVEAASGKVPAGSHLNYTGGTKVMAAHALRAFYARGGSPEHASYLDEGGAVLRYDDGYRVAIDPGGLDLDTLLALHGAEARPSPRRLPDDPSEYDATAIARAVLTAPELVVKLCPWRPHHGKEAVVKDGPIDLLALGVELGRQMIPDPGWSARLARRWARFLCGTWLDVWAGSLARRACPGASVHVGVEATRVDGRQLEVDVVAVVGHRTYVLACTTDESVDLTKLKAFEVALRARQLGGDLARSALASFARPERVTNVQADVNAAWAAPNVPKVFGIEHLRKWGDGDLTSLAHWLGT